MTPLALEMLVFYCTRAKEAGEPHNSGREPQREISAWFLHEGVIEHVGDSIYRATDKGRAWLEIICGTPMPRQQWVDPRFPSPTSGERG